MTLRIAPLHRALDLLAQMPGNAFTKRLAWMRQSISFIEGMDPYDESSRNDLISELQTIAQTAQDAARLVSSGYLNTDPRYGGGL